jgi:hypothetical protein
MMRALTLLALGLLTFTAFGCRGATDSQESPSVSSIIASATPGSEYVAEVNRLCADLLAIYLKTTTPHPGSFPIADYLAEKSKVEPLIEEFDAKVDAITVGARDGPAAEAFDAFRRMSDETEAELDAAAATGDQEAFDAAIVERHETFDSSPVLRDLAAAGIICNAR